MAHKRINIDPDIMGGQPVIKGTRLTVRFLIQQLALGMPREKMLYEYPQLTAEDISAALDYAADQIPVDTVEAA